MNQNLNNDVFSPLENKEEETIDIKNIVGIVINNWHLFLVGVIVCFSIAFIYSYYASPSWRVTSKILVEDPKKGASGAIGGDVGSDLSSLFTVKSSADNEVQILKSRSLMTQLINEFNLNIRTYNKDGFKTTEIYDRAPFIVNILYKEDSLINKTFDVQILDTQFFQLSNKKDKINIRGRF